MAEWKRDVASGLVFLIPLLVSLYAIIWLYSLLAGLPLLGWIDPPIVRVVLTILGFAGAVIVVGMAMRTTAGPVISGLIDAVVNRVPVLRVVYNASQIAVETGVSGNSDLQQPVKVQTWTGARKTAFKTGKYTEDGRMILFMPTAPNITTGYVLEVDPADVEELNETVETALTRVISGGFGEPTDRRVSIPVFEEPSERIRLEFGGGDRQTDRDRDHPPD